MNVEKKLRQMAMLEESTCFIRLRCNERFLALRTLKQGLVSAIKQYQGTALQLTEHRCRTWATNSERAACYV
jgi:hypothetical protein